MYYNNFVAILFFQYIDDYIRNMKRFVSLKKINKPGGGVVILSNNCTFIK